jgi:hypothetical protein
LDYILQYFSKIKNHLEYLILISVDFKIKLNFWLIKKVVL